MPEEETQEQSDYPNGPRVFSSPHRSVKSLQDQLKTRSPSAQHLPLKKTQNPHPKTPRSSATSATLR